MSLWQTKPKFPNSGGTNILLVPLNFFLDILDMQTKTIPLEECLFLNFFAWCFIQILKYLCWNIIFQLHSWDSRVFAFSTKLYRMFDSPSLKANKELLMLFTVDCVDRRDKVFQGSLESHQLLKGTERQTGTETGKW